jgi:hypothetical protein
VLSVAVSLGLPWFQRTSAATGVEIVGRRIGGSNSQVTPAKVMPARLGGIAPDGRTKLDLPSGRK